MPYMTYSVEARTFSTCIFDMQRNVFLQSWDIRITSIIDNDAWPFRCYFIFNTKNSVFFSGILSYLHSTTILFNNLPKHCKAKYVISQFLIYISDISVIYFNNREFIALSFILTYYQTKFLLYILYIIIKLQGN